MSENTPSPDEPTGEGNPPEDERKAPEGDQGKPADEPTGDQGTELAAAVKRAETAEAEAARLRRSNAAQKGTDLDALRDEIRAEFTGQLVRAEIRAAAAGRLRDPSDALALVDSAGLVGAGGDVDPAAITGALDALLKAKPYLAAESAGAAPWGDVGAGRRGASGRSPTRFTA
ncbi:hypothetical protein SSPIM334S_08050 [Streptomyces spiroverticillatus]